MPNVSKGGIERQKAHSIPLASFVTQQKRSKTKNAVPMYAFKPKKRHIPTPIKTRNNTEKTISSARNLHFKNFFKRAFTATEKAADNRKMNAAINTFCVMGLWGYLTGMGRSYTVKGASQTNSASAEVRHKREIKPDFCKPRLVILLWINCPKATSMHSANSKNTSKVLKDKRAGNAPKIAHGKGAKPTPTNA